LDGESVRKIRHAGRQVRVSEAKNFLSDQKITMASEGVDEQSDCEQEAGEKLERLLIFLYGTAQSSQAG
jgi:hypothetical protein